MAAAGERVMVVARRDFDPHTFDPNADLLPLVHDLTLLAHGRHRRSAAAGGQGGRSPRRKAPASRCA